MTYEHTRAIRDRRWAWLQALKEEVCCVICGEDAVEALEFHHHVLPRNFGLNRRELTRAPDAILEELRYCVVLCATCHKLVHAKQIAVCDETYTGFQRSLEEFEKSQELS